jgi:hypothetical protein
MGNDYRKESSSRPLRGPADIQRPRDMPDRRPSGRVGRRRPDQRGTWSASRSAGCRRLRFSFILPLRPKMRKVPGRDNPPGDQRRDGRRFGHQIQSKVGRRYAWTTRTRIAAPFFDYLPTVQPPLDFPFRTRALSVVRLAPPPVAGGRHDTCRRPRPPPVRVAVALPYSRSFHRLVGAFRRRSGSGCATARCASSAARLAASQTALLFGAVAPGRAWRPAPARPPRHADEVHASPAATATVSAGSALPISSDANRTRRRAYIGSAGLDHPPASKLTHRDRCASICEAPRSGCSAFT